MLGKALQQASPRMRALYTSTGIHITPDGDLQHAPSPSTHPSGSWHARTAEGGQGGGREREAGGVSRGGSVTSVTGSTQSESVFSEDLQQQVLANLQEAALAVIAAADKRIPAEHPGPIGDDEEEEEEEEEEGDRAGASSSGGQRAPGPDDLRAPGPPSVASLERALAAHNAAGGDGTLPEGRRGGGGGSGGRRGGSLPSSQAGSESAEPGGYSEYSSSQGGGGGSGGRRGGSFHSSQAASESAEQEGHSDEYSFSQGSADSEVEAAEMRGGGSGRARVKAVLTAITVAGPLR